MCSSDIDRITSGMYGVSDHSLAIEKKSDSN
jgi:hypothetical protein